MCPGVVQGMITGIRGLCNGLGPALYGFIFFLFDVELTDVQPATGRGEQSAQVTLTPSDLFTAAPVRVQRSEPGLDPDRESEPGSDASRRHQVEFS